MLSRAVSSRFRATLPDKLLTSVAVKSAILSTGYQSNDLSVKWEIADAAITVRPPNTFSRIAWDVSCRFSFLGGQG